MPSAISRKCSSAKSLLYAAARRIIKSTITAAQSTKIVQTMLFTLPVSNETVCVKLLQIIMPKFRFLMAVLLCCFSSAFAQELPQFDFTKPETQSQAAREWTAAHDISKIEGTAEGMVISIDGNDPYSFGPARDYPDRYAAVAHRAPEIGQRRRCADFLFHRWPAPRKIGAFSCLGKSMDRKARGLAAAWQRHAIAY